MRPPYHPHHVEYIGAAGNKEVYWTCSCGAVGTYRRLINVPPGQPSIARLMADELNEHRATYVASAPARPGGTPSPGSRAGR